MSDHPRPTLACATLAVAFLATLAGCLPLGLGGSVDEHELAFVDVTYTELRGTDVATSTLFHQIDLFLMPMENSCERFDTFIAELAAAREELDDGLPPEEYCDAWEAIYAEYTGLDGFWVAWFRLQALPRPEDSSPATEYAFFEETAEGQAGGPTFDADLAWYPAPTFAACATEFSGEELYVPTFFTANGGVSRIRAYTEDEQISFRLDPEVQGGDDEPLNGGGEAEFCPAALEWSIEFGRGL